MEGRKPPVTRLDLRCSDLGVAVLSMGTIDGESLNSQRSLNGKEASKHLRALGDGGAVSEFVSSPK